MTVLNSLIIGWSIVWAFTLFALSHVGFNTALVDKPDYIVVLALLFAFSAWAVGCAIIYLVVFWINRIRNSC